jgi:enediyne polyketide synthase
MADDVVIVGMACRYPDAQDPAQLWQNVMSRRRSFRPLPPERLPVSEYGGSGSDQLSVTRAAVLDGWQFDRQRFRVPGGTFRAVDLTHWLALDVSTAALDDAGLPGGEGVDRSRVGVVLGNSLTGEFSRATTLRIRWPYVRRAVAAALADRPLPAAEQADLLAAVERQYKAPFPAPSDETLAGALANTIAGRICNYFDFQGTGYTVDGACASSLLAVMTAAEAVTGGRLDVALAGGVDLSLDPFELVGFSRLGALADGDMRVYDAHPTGFLPGEGCGVVVMCRESYARRRGLRPYARILGWGTSSDGGGGLTRPEFAGQRLALHRAYTRARLEPGEVALVEGHGTGTDVGDLTELRTLLDIRAGTTHRAALGTVKANIGHTKAAAGVAGLIKATLALHRDVRPPTTGCAEPHPLLTDPSATLEVLDEARPWPAGQRYASVSAMGFGGINVHTVLGGMSPSGRRHLSRYDRRLAAPHPDHELVVCAANSREELARRLTAIRDASREMSRGELTDLAATLAAGERGDARARFAAAVADPAALTRAADHALDRLAADASTVVDRVRGVFVGVGRPWRVGLLFSGQAAPCYPDAGALGDLLGELPAGYAVGLPIPDSGPADTAVAQPAIVRSSLAGLRWLDTLGVRAQQAAGHSLGEISALVWAGALTEAEAHHLASERGAAMAAASTVPAGMASLRADRATVTDLVRRSAAVIAAENAPDQIVVSGANADVASVVAEAGRRGIAATWLPVGHAFHSPLMAPAAERLRAAAAQVDWQPPGAGLVSTVAGGAWPDEDPVEVLVRQLTAPVRFSEALDALDTDLLVEVGPGHILTGLAGPHAVSMDAGAHSAHGIATATAALFAAGCVDSAEPYFSRRFTRRFDLERRHQFIANPCETAAPAVADLPPASVASGAAPAATVDPAMTAAEPAGVTPDAAATASDAAAASGPAAATSGPAGGSPEPAATAPDAAGAAEPAADPIAATTARLAAAVELDESALPPRTRLLADLHLTSLRVSQLAAEVATDLGRALPAAPLALATATVEEFAEAIAGLPAAGGVAQPAAGVAPWVRVLGPHLVPRPAPPDAPVTRDWSIVGALAGHPLAGEVRTAFPGGAGRPARLLALPPGLDRVPVEDIVAALRACAADHQPLAVLHHGGVGAAVGRSLAVETPEVPVLVVEVPADADGIAFAAAEAHRPWQGYAEVVYGSGGLRTVPTIRPMEVARRRDDAIPLGSGDTCLVTGGAKGIGVECAAALAAATGAHIVLLGRSPAGDEEVCAARARVAATGAPVSYRSVDLTDRAAVAAIIGEIRERYGAVHAVLHAAGRNEPGAIADLTASKVLATLAPKAAGLENVLDALDPAALRLVVTFGSVIGRTGLAGEADYAIANEWLARRCAELAASMPDVRWLNIEWSAWAGTGMGVRLGVLDGLVRQGLSPIPTDDGVATLMRLLATPDLPPTVVVAGRLPVTQTLTWEDTDEVGARFLESRLAHTPGIELVAEAGLSLGTDPYLADHRIDGSPVLPAVLGLEAMAQSCVALGAKGLPAMFSDVALTRPITVPERDNRTLRVAALAGEDGEVEVVARSSETGYAVDHFRATYNHADGDYPPADPVQVGELVPAQHLYGPLFFHGPRFQRVRGYYGLSAYRCTAAITADSEARWFGAFHDQRLELGDPGARDAFLHVLQSCVPDRRVLPVGVDRIRVFARPQGRLTLDARQREEDGDHFVFDVTVSDAGRSVVEEWRGLALRAIGPVDAPQWPVELLGPYLARGLRRWRPEVTVDCAVAPAHRTERHRTRAVATWLVGAGVEHAADGRLVAARGGTVSASHLDGWVLVASAPGRVAVDWERVADAAPMLDSTDAAVAAELARLTGESEPAAAVRAWTCREVLGKHGLPATAPLVVEEAGPTGWVRLVSGGHLLHSTTVDTTAGTVAFCIGLG